MRSLIRVLLIRTLPAPLELVAHGAWGERLAGSCALHFGEESSSSGRSDRAANFNVGFNPTREIPPSAFHQFASAAAALGLIERSVLLNRLSLAPATSDHLNLIAQRVAALFKLAALVNYRNRHCGRDFRLHIVAHGREVHGCPLTAGHSHPFVGISVGAFSLCPSGKSFRIQ
jgi:hypothetical protein